MFVRRRMQLFCAVSMLLLLVTLIASQAVSPSRALAAGSTLDITNNYKIINQNSGLALGISGASKTAGTAALQWSDNGAVDHIWHFISDGGSNYKIEEMNSGEILGISNGSTAAGATALQWADNGTNDHLWQFVSVGGGYYKIVNQNSGLVLGISGASKANGAAALQWTDNGTSDHLWRLVATGSSYIYPGAVSGDTSVHDPSMIKTANGTYYAFSTTINGSGIEMRSSTDRTTFTNAGSAFSSIPSWTSAYNGGNGILWAPDISYHNGKYWLYYAASSFGSEKSAIGLATSNTAAPGSWADQGIVYTSSSGSGYNAIDPALSSDSSGNYWLNLGSFWNGIYMIQIDPTTGKQASNKTLYHLAVRLDTSKGIEGGYVYHHDSYYYLFASFDKCCSGVNSTYHIVVGRATNITGPYVDEGGINMLQGGGTILLSGHGNIVGPGGNSVMHDTDGDLLVYHYYNGNNNGAATLGLNLLGWDSQDWPYVR